MSSEDVQTVNSRPVIRLRDKVLPLLEMADAFGFKSAKNEQGFRYVVVVGMGKQQMGLAVDRLLGQEEVVVKSLGSIIGEVLGIASAAILGDGSVILIVDVQDLFQVTGQKSERNQKGVGQMAQEIRKIDENFISKMRIIAGRGFTNSAKGLSMMIGQELSVPSPDVNMIPLQTLQRFWAVLRMMLWGFISVLKENLSGQVMIIISYQQALELCDMVMDTPPGTTKELGKMERSALSEIGNLTGTFFLNAIDEITLSSHPSPPAVMVDMVGSILDVVVATMGAIQTRY